MVWVSRCSHTHKTGEISSKRIVMNLMANCVPSIERLQSLVVGISLTVAFAADSPQFKAKNVEI